MVHLLASSELAALHVEMSAFSPLVAKHRTRFPSSNRRNGLLHKRCATTSITSSPLLKPTLRCLHTTSHTTTLFRKTITPKSAHHALYPRLHPSLHRSTQAKLEPSVICATRQDGTTLDPTLLRRSYQFRPRQPTFIPKVPVYETQNLAVLAQCTFPLETRLVVMLIPDNDEPICRTRCSIAVNELSTSYPLVFHRPSFSLLLLLDPPFPTPFSLASPSFCPSYSLAVYHSYHLALPLPLPRHHHFHATQFTDFKFTTHTQLGGQRDVRRVFVALATPSFSLIYRGR